MQETQERQVWSLAREDPLQKEIATHSSILCGKFQDRGAWGAVFMESQRVDWVTEREHECSPFKGSNMLLRIYLLKQEKKCPKYVRGKRILNSKEEPCFPVLLDLFKNCTPGSYHIKSSRNNWQSCNKKRRGVSNHSVLAESWHGLRLTAQNSWQQPEEGISVFHPAIHTVYARIVMTFIRQEGLIFFFPKTYFPTALSVC